MNVKLARFLFMGVLVLCARLAPADLLGTYSSSALFGAPTFNPLVDVPLSFGGSIALGDNLGLFGSLSQQVIHFQSNADDPDYSTFVAKLTDGTDETISANVFLHGTSTGAGGNTTESAAFGTVPDFAGDQITEIRLTIDPFRVTTFAPNQSLPNGLTTVTSEPPGNPMTYRWEVFGTAVPEPATGELWVLAWAALFFKHKIRLRQVESPRL